MFGWTRQDSSLLAGNAREFTEDGQLIIKIQLNRETLYSLQYNARQQDNTT